VRRKPLLLYRLQLTPERQNARTPERQNARTPERQNARTPERQNARTARWRTFPATRTVLAIGRTITSTARVLDALEAFRSDHRVEVLFTVYGGSAFDDGVEALLRDSAAKIVPWDELDEHSYDLTITASENIDTDHIRGPILVLPHGVGFHKFVPTADGTGSRMSGVPTTKALSTNRVHLVLSHPDQRRQILSVYPEAAGHTTVVGDPWRDRLVACAPLRDHYRRCLGISGRQRLVVVSSTWGPQSLLGRWPDLAARLLAELPTDGFRVAAVVHPNVWSHHGGWQLRSWLADALDAGLLLVPPTQGWQAALISADWLIGDHGSVSLYHLALGKPFLLATHGEEVVPTTPMATLGRLAPRLDPATGLLEQLEKTSATHSAERYDRLLRHCFDHCGEAIDKLRALLYSLLELTAPTPAPPVLALPAPTVAQQPPRSLQVHAEHIESTLFELRRHPAVVSHLIPQSSDTAITHLVCDSTERNLRILHSASVFVHTKETSQAEASAWIRTAINEYPGARLVCARVSEGCLVGTRDGRRVLARTDALDPMLVGSAIYTALRSRLPLEGSITARVQGAHTTIHMSTMD
jgi:hypothetical protein